MKDKDPMETYILNGNDFTLYIKPINEYVEGSTVNVDLSECEKVLKQNNPSINFTLLQINLKNNHKNCLVDQVEYKVYDNNKNEVDLSVCNDVEIKIEYKIVNSSQLGLEQIIYFKNKGIDIFNINDTFFNDICYPYSDNNTNSDMILSDRVLDIYQNVSICGDECKYDSFNVDKIVVNCNCKIKNDIKNEVSEGNFETYVESAFLDSNFGVIKCYNLVFGLTDKLENIGFWLFGILIISHIPIYAYYFIKGINPIKTYIHDEMNNKGYVINQQAGYQFPRIESSKKININSNIIQNNPPNKKIEKNKVIDDTRNINNKDIIIANNYAPPKKKIKRKKTSKSMNIKNIINQNEVEIKVEPIEQKNDEITIAKGLNEDIHKKKKKIIKRKFLKSSSSKKNNNLISKTDLNELINEIDEKNNPKLKKVMKRDNKISSADRFKSRDNETDLNSEEKNNNKMHGEYPLILINANNLEKHEIIKSNHILNIYDYDEAIIYDNRSFIRILFIFLISKDNLLNIIFFNPPLELKPLRICIFIFKYSCDLALNALFYLSKNISDKYHYTGANRLLFSLINNITKSLTSTIISFILLYFFQSLTQSSNNIVNLFRKQEDLLKKDKKYKVEEDTKIKIEEDIKKILKCLEVKIICFIIFEFIFLLFFFYYVTAFCQVYKSTQTSWLLDTLTSYLISFLISLVLSLVLSLLYKISLYNKIKILYKISMFIYS